MTGITVAVMRQEHVLEAKRDVGSGDRNQRICRQCGKAITICGRRKYCSKECGTKGNKILIRQWQKTHNENILSNAKIRYRKDPEKFKKRSKEFYRNNPEKVKASNKLWRKNNPKKLREQRMIILEKRRKNRPVKTKPTKQAKPVQTTPVDMKSVSLALLHITGKPIAKAKISIKLCQQCGNAFKINRGKKHCSEECMKAGKREGDLKWKLKNRDKIRQYDRKQYAKRRKKITSGSESK